MKSARVYIPNVLTDTIPGSLEDLELTVYRPSADNFSSSDDHSARCFICGRGTYSKLEVCVDCMDEIENEMD
jgi:hypothetical protein